MRMKLTGIYEKCNVPCLRIGKCIVIESFRGEPPVCVLMLTLMKGDVICFVELTQLTGLLCVRNTCTDHDYNDVCNAFTRTSKYHEKTVNLH